MKQDDYFQKSVRAKQVYTFVDSGDASENSA